MIYTVPTQNGLGINICGTQKDMDDLYRLVYKFCNDRVLYATKGFEDRKKILGEFLEEIKDASNFKEITFNSSKSEVSAQFFKISWVHIIFFLNALKYNMNLEDVQDVDLDYFLNLEDMIGQSMENYDLEGSKTLLPFLEIGFYTGNEYMLMKHINESFFKMAGGKESFRKLSELMRISTYLSDEYEVLIKFLQSQAEMNQCDINDLQFNSDDEIYKKPW